MSTRRRGLGRGLDALLGMGGATAADAQDGELRSLDVESIEPGRYQPRSDMREEALAELAGSIRAQGIVQPIVVRPLEAGRFEIIAGERRWRAARLAGLACVPALVRRIPDRAALSMALIENIQRENLSPLEEARALARLVDEFGLTHEAAAEAVGRSRVTVTNLLRLLSLDAEVRRMLDAGEIEMGHARALLGAAPERQAPLARIVRERGLNVRATEALVREDGTPRARPAPARRNADVERLEASLSERLGAAVAIRWDERGRGTLTIRYASLDELDGILERIR